MLGMNALLKESVYAKKAIKYLLCLPLLPAEKIPEGVSYITQFLVEKHLKDRFETIMRYHERQWIRRVGPNAVSVFQQARRTNNDSESFHASLQRLLRVRGPAVWEFTDGLRNITATVIRELHAFIDEGLQIRCISKRKYRHNNARIKNATSQFQRNQEVGPFLNMVCNTMESLVQQQIHTDNWEVEVEEPLLIGVNDGLPAEYSVVDNHDEEETISIHEEEIEPEPSVEHENVHNRELHGLCIICKENKPTTLLLPCKHFGLCDHCTEELQKRNLEMQRPDEEFGYVVDYSRCPLDRLSIEEFVKVIPT
ncbi:hypothetical protein FQR65_LT19979 [Abscondita terminalis]|nr:hypothetical protein FQR65_LT19979 [Abscondita terminalis]